VVETWRGDAHFGDIINVPELKALPDAIPISQYAEDTFDDSSKVSTGVPRQPAGSRILLFLKRASEASSSNRNPNKWQSADLMGDMKASAVWIEGDRLYCFVQEMNPGPSKLTSCWLYTPGSGSRAMSEVELRARVDEIKRLRAEFDITVAESDGGARAIGLRKFVLSDVPPAQFAALHELGECGSSALPTLRDMVNDSALADYRSDLIKALVQVGGKTVGSDLTDILQQELTFWQNAAASLREGWWNDDMTQHAPLRQHYENAYVTISALQQVPYKGALDTAVRFRRVWLSIPKLDANSKTNQLAIESENLVRLLQSN
jgi:hypothetical protein